MTDYFESVSLIAKSFDLNLWKYCKLILTSCFFITKWADESFQAILNKLEQIIKLFSLFSQ